MVVASLLKCIVTKFFIKVIDGNKFGCACSYLAASIWIFSSPEPKAHKMSL